MQGNECIESMKCKISKTIMVLFSFVILCSFYLSRTLVGSQSFSLLLLSIVSIHVQFVDLSACIWSSSYAAAYAKFKCILNHSSVANFRHVCLMLPCFAFDFVLDFSR